MPTYIVTRHRFVEHIATVEVDARDDDEARALARAIDNHGWRDQEFDDMFDGKLNYTDVELLVEPEPLEPVFPGDGLRRAMQQRRQHNG